MDSIGEKRRAVRYETETRAVVRAILLKPGWHAHIAGGGAVITDVSTGGMKITHDFGHEPGTILRILVPAERGNEDNIELTVKVVWRVRNDDPAYGRHTCGLSFTPAVQPGAYTLVSRFRDHGLRRSPALA